MANRRGKVDQLYDFDALKEQDQKVKALLAEFVDHITKVKPIVLKLEGTEKITEMIQGMKAAEQATDKTVTTVNKAGAEYAKLSEIIKRSSATYDQQKSIMEGYSGSIENNIKIQLKYKERLEEIKKAMRDLEQFKGLGGEGAQKIADQVAALTAEQLRLKHASSELAQTLKTQTKEAMASAGSNDQAAAKVGLLRDAYRSLNEEQKKSEFGQQLTQEIQKLDAFLKEDDAVIGNHFRKVGDYAGGLGALFDALGTKITSIQKAQSSVQSLTPRNQVGFVYGTQQSQNQAPGDPAGTNPSATAQLSTLQTLQTAVTNLSAGGAQQIHVVEKALEDAGKAGALSAEEIKEIQIALDKLKPAEYSGRFRDAYSVLVKSLEEVRTKLKDPAFKGADLAKLQQEEKALNQVTSNLSRAFSSTREELKAFQEAAKVLGLDLGSNSEAFQAFAEEVGGAKDEVEDIQGIVNQSASDTKFLDGAIEGINGIAGAYGAATGAAALFGGSSEELQKQMVKLQAVMTIINGLQQVQKTLQSESAAMQTFLAAKTKILNAAKQLEVLLFGEAAAAQQSEALAAEQNAVANEAAAGAQAANAEASVATTSVMEVQTVATNTATVATGRLRAALLSSGILAAIAALVYGVVKAVEAIKEWANADEAAIEREKALADITSEQNEIIERRIGLLAEGSKSTISDIQNQLNVAQAAGKSQETLFAIRKRLADENKTVADKQLQEQIARAEKEDASISNGIKGYKALESAKQLAFIGMSAKLNEYNNLLDDKRSAALKGNKDEVESINKKVEKVKSELDKESKAYGDYSNAINSSLDSKKEREILATEESKFSADERRKIALASVQNEVDLAKTRNDLILNNERSTLGQRLQAIRSNATEESRLIRAQRDDVMNNPSATGGDKLIAMRTAAKEQSKVKLQVKEEERRMIADDTMQRQQLQNAANKTMLERDIEVNRQISESQVFTLEQRLQALQKYSAAQRNILDTDYKYQLKQAGLSDEEIAAFQAASDYEIKGDEKKTEQLRLIRVNHETGMLRLVQSANAGMTNVIKTELDKQRDAQQSNLDQLELLFKQHNVSKSSQYAADVIALNESLHKQEIGVSEYHKRRKKLDQDYSVSAAQEALDNIDEQLKLYEGAKQALAKADKRLADEKKAAIDATTAEEKKAAADRVDIAQKVYNEARKNVDKQLSLEEQAAQKSKEISDSKTQKQIDDLDKVKAAYEELGHKVLDFVQAMGDGGFEAESQSIQNNLDMVEKKKAKDIEVATQTIANTAEREKAIKTIEARSAAEKESLERRQRENSLRQAKFDRDMQIIKIVGETAIQVAKYGFFTPMGIAASIAGALSVAMLLAKPLPKYARGTDYHPGGRAIVGDGGRSEYAVTPTGDIIETPAVPTIMDLPTGTKVFKDEMAFLAAMDRLNMGAHERALASPGGSVSVETDKMERIMKQGLKDITTALRDNKQNKPPSTDLRDWVHS